MADEKVLDFDYSQLEQSHSTLVEEVIKLAKENEAQLLTTEKDYNRIKNKYYNNIKSVVTKINIVDKNKFVGVLQKII